MEFTFATPALLFPAVSLLFISYTNRFVSYADLVRRLHERWRTEGDTVVARQISNLRRRIVMIRNMQIAGAFSLLFCVVCMIVLFFGMTVVAETLFAAALFLMLVSLALLVVEVSISVRALELQLGDLERGQR
jgi:hypothetical protein